MPFSGFICDSNGYPVLAPDCVQCAELGGLLGCHQTPPVLRGILDHMRPDDFGLTVTTLLGCPRKTRLMAQEPYLLKPAEMWWSFRGTLIHEACAKFAVGQPHIIAEQRFEMQVPARTLNGTEQLATISGQPDLVDTAMNHLIDYKTTARVPGPWRRWTCPETGHLILEQAFAYRNKWMECPHCHGKHEAKTIEEIGEPRAYPHHVQQVNLYALLLHEHGIQIDTAEVVYLDMRRQLRVMVELWPLEQARKLLAERVVAHSEPGMPPVLTGEDTWQCNYCPVREICEQLHGNKVGAVADSELEF